MDQMNGSKEKEMSESDISLENWTLLDTEEAYEATLLDEVGPESRSLQEPNPEAAVSLQTSEEGYQSVPVVPSSGPVEEEEQDTPGQQEEDSEVPQAVPSQHQNPATLDGAGAHTDSDDGVSIITDSEPEELGLQQSTIPDPPVAPAICLQRRGSRQSNDYFDQSDLSVAQDELPVELNQSKDRRYVHQPNKKVDILLNGLLVLCATAVLGLGVGHFLGLQEECPIPHGADVVSHSELMGPDAAALLHKLEEENEILKFQLRQLHKGVPRDMDRTSYPRQLDVKQGWEMVEQDAVQLQWDIPHAMADPDHRTEAADVVQAAQQELADNLDKAELASRTQQTPGLQEVPGDVLLNDLTQVATEQAAGSEERQSFESSPPPRRPKDEKPQYPYSDEDLEAFQTRYAKAAQIDYKPVTKPTDSNVKKEVPPGRISFFSKMEAELNVVLDQIVNYSSNLVENTNVKDHVSSSLKTLSTTLEDMKGKIRSISEKTSQHGSQAMEKVKKSVYKMVQNVKYTSERVLKSKPEEGTLSSKMLRGFNHLKDGLVNKWCHLKGKMSRNFGGQERDVMQHCLAAAGAKHVPREDMAAEGPLPPTPSTAQHEHQSHPPKQLKQFPKNGKYNKTASQKYKNPGSDYKSQPVKFNPKNPDNSRPYKKGKGQKRRQEKWVREERKRGGRRDRCLDGGRCNGTDGRWMERMAKGRAGFRQSERESEWMFDRSKARQEWRGKQTKGGWTQKQKGRNFDMFQEHGSQWVPNKYA